MNGRTSGKKETFAARPDKKSGTNTVRTIRSRFHGLHGHHKISPRSLLDRLNKYASVRSTSNSVGAR